MELKRRLPVLALVLAASVASGTQGAEMDGEMPSLNGVWSARIGAFSPVGGGEVPFQPWAKEIYDEVNERMAVDAPFVDNRTICLPDGAVDAMFTPYPNRFVQTPEKLYILLEFANQSRTVFMDGTHPTDLQPTWYGHSIGHWEDDTLVVETVGFNDRTPLMTLFGGGGTRTNLPHTDQLRVTERFSLSEDGNTLTNLMTIDDPGAFTMPWSLELNSRRLEDRRIMEFVCADDPVLTDPDEPVDLDGLITVGPDGKTPMDG